MACVRGGVCFPTLFKGQGKRRGIGHWQIQECMEKEASIHLNTPKEGGGGFRIAALGRMIQIGY